MLPELGKYAGAVLLAYGLSLVLVIGLIGQSLWRNAQVRRDLATREARLAGRNARAGARRDV